MLWSGATSRWATPSAAVGHDIQQKNERGTISTPAALAASSGCAKEPGYRAPVSTTGPTTAFPKSPAITASGSGEGDEMTAGPPSSTTEDTAETNRTERSGTTATEVVGKSTSSSQGCDASNDVHDVWSNERTDAKQKSKQIEYYQQRQYVQERCPVLPHAPTPDVANNDGQPQDLLESPTFLPEEIVLAPASNEALRGGLGEVSPGSGGKLYAAKFHSPRTRSVPDDMALPSSLLSQDNSNEMFASPTATSVKTASSFRWEPGVGGLEAESGASWGGGDVKDEGAGNRLIGAWASEEDCDKDDDTASDRGEKGKGEQGNGRRQGSEEESRSQQQHNWDNSSGNNDNKAYYRQAEQEEKECHTKGDEHTGKVKVSDEISTKHIRQEKEEQQQQQQHEARGPATSHCLGMYGPRGGDRDDPAPEDGKEESDSWGVDDSPRLDDYFRGQAPVPPSERDLLPPPFHGGIDGSPLFPSPPLEGKALYGVSTWSFASDAEGDEPIPSAFAIENNRTGGTGTNASAADNMGSGKRGTETHAQKPKNKPCSKAWTRPANHLDARDSPISLQRGGRRVVVSHQRHRYRQDKQEHDHHKNQDGKGNSHRSSYDGINNKKRNNGVLSAEPSITSSDRRRRSTGSGGNNGGHQKRHQEWLDKFGEEKRMERQEGEAKALRRQAARRRTRDLLLERAKQRLHAAASAASGKGPIDAANSGKDGAPSTVTGKGGGGTSLWDVASDGLGSKPLYLQDTTSARHSKVERQGEEEKPTPEEKERLDKERFKRIAATRRRQKEQHKRFLAALKARRIQEEEERLEQERKEAEKRNNIRMWAERRLHQKITDGEHDRRRSRSVDSSGVIVTSVDRGDGGVAGSGLNAIRSRGSYPEDVGGQLPEEFKRLRQNSRKSEGQSEKRYLKQTTDTNHEADDDQMALMTAEELAARALSEKEERRKRLVEVKMAREKAQEHLEALKNKKKAREEEEETKRRRQARRMRLLRAKVLVIAKELRENGGKANVQQRREKPESSEDERDTQVHKPRLTDEEMQASVDRLTQQPKGGAHVPASARDFSDWKRKRAVSNDTKVFVMTGWYPCVKQALLRRGWTQNPDRDSPFFDLKWTLHSQDIRSTDIQPWQWCNHFFKNVAITTKAGLLGNLRNLKWLADVDCSEVFPRGYDLSLETDVQSFLDDYCATAAESLLKHVLLRAKGRGALRLLGAQANRHGHKPPRGSSGTSSTAHPASTSAVNHEKISSDVDDSDNTPKHTKGKADLWAGDQPERTNDRINRQSDGADAEAKAGSDGGADGVQDDDKEDDSYDDGFDESFTEETERRRYQPKEQEDRQFLFTPSPPGSSSLRSKMDTATTVLVPAGNRDQTALSLCSPRSGQKVNARAAAMDHITSERLQKDEGAINLLSEDKPIFSNLFSTEHENDALPLPTESVGDISLPTAEVSSSETLLTTPDERNPPPSGMDPARHHSGQQDSETFTVRPPLCSSASVKAKREAGNNMGDMAGTDGGGTRNRGEEGARKRQAPPVSARRRPWDPEGPGFEVNCEILGAAVAVCRRRLASAADRGLDASGAAEPLCSELERELIDLGTGGGAPHPDMPGLYRSHSLSSRPATPIEAFWQSGANANDGSPSGKEGARIGGVGWEARAAGSQEERRRTRLQYRLQLKLDDNRRAASAVAVRSVAPLGAARLRAVEETLEAMKASEVQFDLNGDFCQNMWIVKPAAKSRGRGIECFTDLRKLLAYTESRQHQAVSQWVVHKYIENPLIIARRKFDLRQWVLVTDWNPLTVWFYDECYVRFGVEEYTTSGNSLGNSFVHLVNNSICKKSDKFGNVATTENGFVVREHMWPNDAFTAYVDDVAGKGCWRERMQPRMKQTVTWSLLCAQDMVEHRKKSWELYGYDFMVDEQYKPWLIEINSSPACDYSTKVTEEYVQNALTDLLKVTIDLPAWEANRRHAKAPVGGAGGDGKGGGSPDTIAASAAPPTCPATSTGEVHHGVAWHTPTDAIIDNNSQENATDGDIPNRHCASNSQKVDAMAEGERRTAEGLQKSLDGDCVDPDGGDLIDLDTSGPAYADVNATIEPPLKKSDSESRDHPEPVRLKDRNQRGESNSAPDPPDTGLWSLLYKGPFVPFPLASFGIDLALKGTKISKRGRS